MNSHTGQRWLLAVLMLVAGVLIFMNLFLLRSRADNASSSASVNNEVQVISTIRMCQTRGCSTSYTGTLTPTESSSVTMYLEATYSDGNGCLDVASSTNSNQASLYRESVTCTASANFDDRKCYGKEWNKNGVCNTTCSADGTIGTMSCAFPIWWNADATDGGTYESQKWVGFLETVDMGSSSQTSSTPTFEIGTLNALDLSAASVNFGSIALGGTGSDQTLNIINTGNNNALDLTLLATNMSCDKVGSINATNIRMATNADVSYVTKGLSAFTFSTSNQNITTFDLLKSITTSTATRASSTVYLQLGLPSSGVAGTCTGTITFTGA